MERKDKVKEETLLLIKRITKDMRNKAEILLDEINYETESGIIRLPNDIICAILKDLEYIHQPARSAKENHRRIERLFHLL